MEKNGVTVMIGLLGKDPEMVKEDGLLGSECPLATQDEIINKGNKQKAILLAELGPPQVKGQNCGNCEYGREMTSCGVKPTEVYCELFDFKCMKKNWCNHWEEREPDDVVEELKAQD